MEKYLTQTELQVKLQLGEVIRDGDNYYTKDVWEQLREARKQEAHYDLLQLTKKIQL